VYLRIYKLTTLGETLEKSYASSEQPDFRDNLIHELITKVKQLQQYNTRLTKQIKEFKLKVS
jgi:hypothetical protein